MTRLCLFVSVAAFFSVTAWSEQTHPTLDVRSYGAKGDGVTDDSAGIQAAIDACPANGVVMIPAGDWLVKSKALALKSGVTLNGAGDKAVVVCGSALKTAVDALEASNLTVENLKFVVEPSTPAKEVGQLVHFKHCTRVTLSKCTLDGTTSAGLSRFSLCQFECCNQVKCLDSHFSHVLGSATGCTGAAWEPTWGRGSEFARNTIEDYRDTGIGLWTGARDANIHDNKILGPAAKVPSFPAGIDIDGGTDSVIANNEISGGQIAIRLFDTHNGSYPIGNLIIRGNYLHDQVAENTVHPALAVKPENPKSKIEATFTKNRIVESEPNSYGFMGGGAGQTILHIDETDFTGPAFWSFGFYKDGAIQILSAGAPVDWKSAQGSNKTRKSVNS